MEKRFELKYNEQITKHYAVDHERKIQLGHKDMINLLNEQDQKIKELEEVIKNREEVIWDENGDAVLCGDCYCINNDVKRIIKENQQLKQLIKQKDQQIAELKETTESIVSTAYYKLARATEIIKLKEQLHTQPKEIVEMIKQSNIYLNSSKPNQKDHIYDSYLVEAKTLDKILKEYERKNV